MPANQPWLGYPSKHLKIENKLLNLKCMDSDNKFCKMFEHGFLESAKMLKYT